MFTLRNEHTAVWTFGTKPAETWNHTNHTHNTNIVLYLLSSSFLPYEPLTHTLWRAPSCKHVSYGDFSDKSLLHLCFPGCLYNITADPHETNNVALEHPFVVARLRGRLAEFRKTHYVRESDLSDISRCGAAIEANNNFMGPWLP